MPFILGSGLIVASVKAKERCFGRTDQSTKGTGTTTWQMVKGD